MRQKLKSQTGMARLVIILAVIAGVMLILTVYPIAANQYEKTLQKNDEEYIDTAERLLLNDSGTEVIDSVLIYDSKNKSFVKASKISQVSPYASSKKHKNEYVVAYKKTGGDVVCTWKDADSIMRIMSKKGE